MPTATPTPRRPIPTRTRPATHERLPPCVVLCLRYQINWKLGPGGSSIYFHDHSPCRWMFPWWRYRWELQLCVRLKRYWRDKSLLSRNFLAQQGSHLTIKNKSVESSLLTRASGENIQIVIHRNQFFSMYRCHPTYSFIYAIYPQKPTEYKEK